jgi:hypothetical protein
VGRFRGGEMDWSRQGRVGVDEKIVGLGLDRVWRKGWMGKVGVWIANSMPAWNGSAMVLEQVGMDREWVSAG